MSDQAGPQLEALTDDPIIETRTEKHTRAKPRQISDESLQRTATELVAVAGPVLCASPLFRFSLLLAGGIYHVGYPILGDLQAIARKHRRSHSGFKKAIDALIERKMADQVWAKNLRVLLQVGEDLAKELGDSEPPEVPAVHSKDTRREMHKLLRAVKKHVSPVPRVPSDERMKAALQSMLALAGGGRGRPTHADHQKIVKLAKERKLTQWEIAKKVWPKQCERANTEAEKKKLTNKVASTIHRERKKHPTSRRYSG